jgi:hypothetical protein
VKRIVNLLRLILATWRLTSLLVQERGPDAVFERIRDHYRGTEVGMALSCVWCTSLWVAIVIVLLDRICPVAVDILAVSTGAIAVDKYNSD